MAKTKSPYRAIPAVTGADGLDQVVDALKENVEMMQGLRGNVGLSNQVFTNSKKDPPVGFRTGDVWLTRDGAGPWSVQVWINDQWT